MSPCNAWHGGQGLCLGWVAAGWSSGSTWASVLLPLALGASVDVAQGFLFLHIRALEHDELSPRHWLILRVLLDLQVHEVIRVS